MVRIPVAIMEIEQEHCGNCFYALRECPIWPNTWMIFNCKVEKRKPFGCLSWKSNGVCKKSSGEAAPLPRGMERVN